MRDDVGKLIGMSAWFALEDLEEACASLSALGCEGMSIVYTQVASRLIPAPVFEAHYAAAGELVREAGLIVSTLNVIEDPPAFDPFTSDEAMMHTARRLSQHLRDAVAMGAPGILIWDGRVSDEEQAGRASRELAECVGRARELAGAASDAVQVSVELHPFTFALKYRKLEELAAALPDVGAGICVDFCHFGVALGGDFLDVLPAQVMDGVSEVHYSDTDCATSEFHFPAGRGKLDLAALESHFRGRHLPVGLDLFQWPAPRSGARTAWPQFSSFVRAQLATV